MSVEFGGLRADPAFREISSGSTASTTARDESMGTWPEEIGAVASSSFTLRGMGSRPDSCGAWYPLDWCDVCGEPDFRQSHCEMRDCPHCWKGNIARVAEAGTARISGARHAQDSYSEKRTVHAVISPPAGKIRTVQQVYSGFGDAYDVAKKHGIRGGCAIFHGYRAKESTKREFEEIKKLLGLLGMCPEAVGHGESMALWDFIRSHRQDWRELTYWSPHYHVIGLAEDFEPADPDGDDGWVAWRIRDLADYRMSDPVTGDDAFSDTAGLIRYLMSHASHETLKEKDSIRWFGDLATVNFSMDELALSSKRQIKEKAEKAVYGSVEEAGSGGLGEERECPQDDCEGELRPIWDAFAALRDRRFTESISSGAEDRLRTAAEWMMGDLDPPPVRSKSEARDTLDELAENL